MPNFIDPEELPFTDDEIFRAACLIAPKNGAIPPETAARSITETLVKCGPGVIEAREKRRADWRNAKMPNAHWQPLYAWAYPDELLPALASLSPDAESRARFLMEDHWKNQFRGTVGKMQREALEVAGLSPTTDEMMQMVAKEIRATKQKLKRKPQAFTMQGPIPALPTSAMVAAAHQALAKARME